MSNEEFDRLREALRQAPTAEARKEAAEAMKRYNVSRAGRGSSPTLVSLGYKKTYPSAIPLENIPEEIERNPEFYELMKKVVE